MRVLDRKLLALCGLVCALLLWAWQEQVSAGNSHAVPERAQAGESVPWLMVGLSPNGCSKGCRSVFSAIEAVSGNSNGITAPFWKVTPEYVAEMKPAFLVLSPQSTPWCRYSGPRALELQNFLWTLPVLAEEMNIPILGVCGGHQALALAFGGRVGPIRAGEHDCLPYTRSGQRGVVPLTMVTPDPIFRGIHGTVRMAQSHYDEVKVLPPGFVLLASERHSPIQIMRHPTKPVYGVQGHPEKFRSNRPDGGLLLRNFVAIAETYAAAVRRGRRAVSSNSPQEAPVR